MSSRCRGEEDTEPGFEGKTVNKEQIRECFDKMASERDRWLKRGSYYHDDIKKFLRFLIPADASVLEIGCATGEVTAHLAKQNSRIKGIDFSPAMIEAARKKYPDLDFAVADVEEISGSEKYDYLILSDVVGFLSDVQSAFSRLRELSHPGTRMIISSYNHIWKPAVLLAEKLKLKMPQPLENWLTAIDLEQLLYLAGFETVKRGRRMLIPMYVPLVSALFNRYLAKLPFFRTFCLTHYFVARPRPVRVTGREPSVSVIVPARNEKGNIEAVVQRLPLLGSGTEIVFVEGHSSDQTWDEILRVTGRHPDKDIQAMKQDGVGKGNAVRKGFDAAHGDILMILDADLTVRPEELPKFYEAVVRRDGDFINGSRLVYPMEEESMRALNVIGNKFFSLAFSWLLEQPIKDTLCGTKVLWKEDYERIKRGRSFFGEFDPFGDFDLLFGAAKLNLKIIDLPVQYRARTYGATNISRFKHGWLLLQMCLFAMRKIKFI